MSDNIHTLPYCDVKFQEYQSHKCVKACKIRFVSKYKDGSAVIELESGIQLTADSAYMNKHNPQEGGYYVVYADGYRSYSPAEAFDEGYTKIVKLESFSGVYGEPENPRPTPAVGGE